MGPNVGATDRRARIATGAILGPASMGVLSGALPFPTPASPVLDVVALNLLVTGVTGA